jgi:hypothetical protein
MPLSAIFEKAQFTDAKKADYRSRWLLLLAVLLVVLMAWWTVRDLVYDGMLHRFAQRTFNDIASASIEKIGSVSIDRQGDVILRNAEAWTHARGHRLFFRTEELRITLDGTPFRDRSLRVMRVDLVRPEIFIRREVGGEWNIEWALLPAPRPPEAPPPAPAPDEWKDYLRPDESFPRNGVNIHQGTVHVTFVSKSGREVVWTITDVSAALVRVDGTLMLKPATGDFYGGRIKLYAEIPKTSPLTIRQLTVDVRDADVSRMARGRHFIKYDRTRGKFNGVVALTVDREKTGHTRPIASGYGEITEGDLWDLPSFSSIIHLLSLSSVSDKRIDSAIFEFTVEEEHIRVDKMYFLGYPVSLFGDGKMSLTGDWIDIEFLPRLGKKDWNSILPIIGAPIDLLSRIFYGAFVHVKLTGTFDSPRLEVGKPQEPGQGADPKPEIRKLMEEKGPR